jgi:hypothetical protein
MARSFKAKRQFTDARTGRKLGLPHRSRAETAMIPCQRHPFNIPETRAYLNCSYLSPLMKAVREAGRKGGSLRTVSRPDRGQ